MSHINQTDTLNIELDVLLATIGGAKNILCENGDLESESVLVGLNTQYWRVKESYETLLEKQRQNRKNRTIDPHGIFVKRGETDEDVMVQLLERFRDGDFVAIKK